MNLAVVLSMDWIPCVAAFDEKTKAMLPQSIRLYTKADASVFKESIFKHLMIDLI